MKRQFRQALLSLGLISALSLPISGAFAQSGPEGRPAPPQTITTVGHGEARVKPDALRVTVSVETQATKLDAARAENNAKMQAVISSLKGLNIPGITLETSNVNINPMQDYSQGNRPRITGYSANNTLSVTVRNATGSTLPEYGSKIMDTALNAGANNVYGLDFFLDDMGAARAVALTQAMQDARRNAETLATAAGVVISGVQSIDGAPQYVGQPRPYMTMAKSVANESAQAATPVEAGDTSVTCDVTVRYRF